MERTCSIADCPNPVRTGGLCQSHYLRFLRHGSPHGGSYGRGHVMRFAQAVAQYDGPVCIIWPFYIAPDGYGRMTVRGRPQTAHRVVLGLAKGEPPRDRMDAAHAAGVCWSRACVNPNHLRWATRYENEQDKKKSGTYMRRGVMAV